MPPRAKKVRESAAGLTDEEVLKEFVNRFQCDGAVLIYLDNGTQYGFARWRNRIGRVWAKHIFELAKMNTFTFPILNPKVEEEGGMTIKP